MRRGSARGPERQPPIHELRLGVLAASLAAVAISSHAPTAAAQVDWAGTWSAGRTRIRVQVDSWGEDCGGQAPTNTTLPAAGQIRITQEGDHLVFHGRPPRRTDGCWSDNRAVRRASVSQQQGVWTVVCRTPSDDSRAETGTYTLQAQGEDRLVLTDQSRYDWRISGSQCKASITSTQTFSRVRAQDVPAPPTEPAPAAACRPGAAARIRLRPDSAEVEPGERLRFRGQVVDAAGCALRERSFRWELRGGIEGRDEIRSGQLTVANDPVDGERVLFVRASASRLTAEARVVVSTPDLSDLIARRAGGVVSGLDDADDADELGGAPTSAAGVRARAPQRSTSLIWPLAGVGTALVAIVLLALFIVWRRRSARAITDGAGLETPQRPVGGVVSASARAPTAPRICPVCHREYADPALGFCAADGSALVEPQEMPTSGQALICPTCRRGYAPGTKTCPADGESLLPYTVFVERHKAREAAVSDLAMICPKCGDRYGRQVRFCGRDGVELVVVN